MPFSGGSAPGPLWLQLLWSCQAGSLVTADLQRMWVQKPAWPVRTPARLKTLMGTRDHLAATVVTVAPVCLGKAQGPHLQMGGPPSRGHGVTGQVSPRARTADRAATAGPGAEGRTWAGADMLWAPPSPPASPLPGVPWNWPRPQPAPFSHTLTSAGPLPGDPFQTPRVGRTGVSAGCTECHPVCPLHVWVGETPGLTGLSSSGCAHHLAAPGQTLPPACRVSLSGPGLSQVDLVKAPRDGASH